MQHALAYLNGHYIPADELSLPVFDAGFVQGATITEQVRTFAGNIFCLDAHLQRLARGLEITGIDPGITISELAAVAESLVRKNHALLQQGDDLGLSIFITPGPYSTLLPTQPTRGNKGEKNFSRQGRRPEVSSQATVCLHTYLLPFHLWDKKYRVGESLVVSDVRQIPSECWPPELKCRSRMHYFLADKQAQARDPQDKALLRNLQGNITETSTANIVLYFRDSGLVSPPREEVLAGISLRALQQIAHDQSIPFVFKELTPRDVLSADEAFLTSTPYCLLPIVRLDRKPIGTGEPGLMYTHLLASWGAELKIELVAQAERFARR